MPNEHSTPEEMFAYWQRLSGDDCSTPWEEEENLGMFFQGFRPHGEGVEAVFEGVVGREELLPRLLEVYRVTAEGGENDGYFIVRNPQPLAAETAEALCRELLEKVAQISAEFDAEEGDAAYDLRALLDPLPVIRVTAGERPWPPDDEAPEGLIYEVTGDYMRYLEFKKKPVESHAHLLDEALYTLACDYDLAHHILWPLYRHLTEITEPFRAYFELWKHGAGYRFTAENEVTVYVPNLLTQREGVQSA